jgi:DNA-binding Lrp family transcriptional regulator
MNAAQIQAEALAVRAGALAQPFDATDLRLLERLHGDFPLTASPFADIGEQLGLAEAEVIERLRRMLDDGLLTRFGPLFQIERAGGCFVLAAMEVPAERFEAVAAQVNAFSEVAHNYQREHRLNMWFVIATESQAAAEDVRRRIEAVTGLEVIALPKEREYYLELRLPLVP